MWRAPEVFTLGHSPDPDDAFMFYAIAKNKIDLRGYRFNHRLEDIQTLNERALRGELHISAISIHAYAYVAEQYALLLWADCHRQNPKSEKCQSGSDRNPKLAARLRDRSPRNDDQCLPRVATLSRRVQIRCCSIRRNF